MIDMIYIYDSEGWQDVFWFLEINYIHIIYTVYSLWTSFSSGGLT